MEVPLLVSPQRLAPPARQVQLELVVLQQLAHWVA